MLEDSGREKSTPSGRSGKKSEQEAFSRYGLTYIVDEYLPKKLKLKSNES